MSFDQTNIIRGFTIDERNPLDPKASLKARREQGITINKDAKTGLFTLGMCFPEKLTAYLTAPNFEDVYEMARSQNGLRHHMRGMDGHYIQPEQPLACWHLQARLNQDLQPQKAQFGKANVVFHTHGFGDLTRLNPNERRKANLTPDQQQVEWGYELAELIASQGSTWKMQLKNSTEANFQLTKKVNEIAGTFAYQNGIPVFQRMRQGDTTKVFVKQGKDLVTQRVKKSGIELDKSHCYAQISAPARQLTDNQNLTRFIEHAEGLTQKVDFQSMQILATAFEKQHNNVIPEPQTMKSTY